MAPGSKGTESCLAQVPPTAHGRRLGTVGLSHLQFEAVLALARASANSSDFALVAMLASPGLQIFEATRTDINDRGEEHGRRVLHIRQVPVWC